VLKRAESVNMRHQAHIIRICYRDNRLALTSPTSGGRSVSTVPLRNKATELARQRFYVGAQDTLTIQISSDFAIASCYLLACYRRNLAMNRTTERDHNQVIMGVKVDSTSFSPLLHLLMPTKVQNLDSWNGM
jgi:hypothetical protein